MLESFGQAWNQNRIGQILKLRVLFKIWSFCLVSQRALGPFAWTALKKGTRKTIAEQPGLKQYKIN